MISLLASLVFNFSHASYPYPYNNLMNGKTEQFKSDVFAEILKPEVSKELKKSYLRVLLAHQKTFYNLLDFRGKALPFNSEECTKENHNSNICSFDQGYEFRVYNEVDHQSFLIHYRGNAILNYRPEKRTSLSFPKISFGKIIHMISPVKSPQRIFTLIRETEGEVHTEIRQTLNAFLIEEATACKIIETDLKELDDSYDLLVEFLRVFGDKIHCPFNSLYL